MRSWNVAFVVGLSLAVGEWGQSPRAIDLSQGHTKGHVPALTNTCMITSNMAQLLEFYSRVLEVTPQLSGSDYAEFRTPVGVLAIFSSQAQEKYIPHATVPASNRSAILEFEVADVDREYARLQSTIRVWVKPPTSQPWGTRSIYFRDPDGNLVDFFSYAKT